MSIYLNLKNRKEVVRSMPKFAVSLTEEIQYNVILEAETMTEAIAIVQANPELWIEQGGMSYINYASEVQ